MRVPVYRLGLVLICVAGPSFAAPKTDYSLNETRRLMDSYAKCVVQRRSALASEALLRNVDNSTILKDYRALIDGDCLTKQTRMAGKMTFAGDLYRYALADALVAREFGTAGPTDFSTVPKLDQREIPEPPLPLTNSSRAEKRRYERELQEYNEARGFRVLAAIGECAVRLNPVGARQLVLSRPTSADEDRLFESMKPTLAQCLPEGETVNLGKLAVRGTIAVSYYRLAHRGR